MNPGIFYVYEYKQNSRLRNVGFLKLLHRPGAHTVQLQLRNIPVTAGERLTLAVFTSDENGLPFQELTEVPCLIKSISCNVSVPDGMISVPFSDIRGFCLTAPDRFTFAAVDTDGLFDTRALYSPAQKPAEDTPSDTPSFGAPPSEDALPRENISEEPVLEAESLPEEPEAPDTETSDSPGPIARKVQRSDLTVLPRCCWNLANNSFLMHGYYNYNHLLLIEEDGHYWLGVPGIFDKRESRAAELFGFPQFSRDYNEVLQLSKDERNDEADFGYWCRYVR